jgi:ubiquinone/menaquinone biosynthesis C-methylase UbiE
MMEDPIALEAYERLAEAYAARVGTKAHNAHYERPATLSLLPPVEGKCVLDAGCGPGVYSEWLVERGAEVVALDVSPTMIRLARERLRGRARLVQADLGRDLDGLADRSFDLVLSALALDYVRDWGSVFKEFFRVLRPDGHLVFSSAHPFDEFYDHHRTGNYFQVERVEYEWNGFGVPVRVPSYRRPLSAMITPLLEAGFLLERLLEPLPQEPFQEQDPRDYAKLIRQPGFICFRAKRPSAA